MLSTCADMSGPQRAVLLVTLCGIVYELLIATISSYLLGDSVRQFSITIGLSMAAMGLGAYLTKFIEEEIVRDRNVNVAWIGGASPLGLPQ